MLRAALCLQRTACSKRCRTHCNAASLSYHSRWLACCRCLNAALVAYCCLEYARILSWRAALNSGSSAYLRFKYAFCLLYSWPVMCRAVIKI